jgi:hypothetical protein
MDEPKIHIYLDNGNSAYSNILPRRTWRYSNNTDAMERTGKRLNRGLRTYLLQNNSYAIAHPDFDD